MKMGKVAVGGLAALVLVAAGALGAELLARRAMVRQVETALAQPPFLEASHGAIRYSLWRARLEIHDLAFKTDLAAPRSFRAAEVTVAGVGPSLLLGRGGDLALAAIRAQQVEATGGGLQASAATLALDGVQVIGGLQPEAPSSARDALAALFERVSVDRLDLGAVHLWSDAHAVDVAFDTVSAEHLAKGRVAGVTATKGVALVQGGGGEGKLRVALAQLSLAGVDGVALRWIVAPQTAPGDGAVAIAEGMKLGGLTLAAGRGVLTAETLSLAGLRLRPGAPLSVASPAALGQLFGGASLDHLELQSVDVRSVEATDRRLSLARLAIDKLRPGGVGGIAAETLALDAPNMVARLGAFEVTGLAYARQGTPIGVPRMFADRIELRNLSAGVKPGAEVTVKDASVAMEGTLASPSGARMEIGPVTVPAAAAPALARLGYEALVLDYDSRTHYDAAAARMSLTQHLAAQDAGKLALSLQLGHYPPALEAPDAATLSLRLMRAELEHLELRYDDASLAGRLLKLYAETTGRDVDSVQQEFAARARAQRQALAGKPALLASLDAVEAFLRKPGTLTLVLAPPKPVTLGTLVALARQNPDQALASLGLSVR